MIPRAWMIWGGLAILVGSLEVHAKPPESLIPLIDGTATPILTQNYFQPEPGPSPRMLDVPAVIPAVQPQPKRGVPLPIALPADLDAPIRASFLKAGNWQADTAFAIAELNLEAGDVDEAHRWYEEVIKQAPGSFRAIDASDRIERTKRRSK